LELIALLTIAAQIFFAVHAVRTGRHGWLFFLFFFPGIASLIYFITQYLPEIQQSKAPRKIAKKVVSTIDPTRQIRELEGKLALTNSFANRVALADAYVAVARFEEALDLYTQSAKGVHKNDPSVARGLAHVHYRMGNLEAAKTQLEELRAGTATSKRHETELFYAHILEELGETENALALYEELTAQNLGEEARCKMAMLLDKMGRNHEAQKHYKEIVDNAGLLPKHYRKAQKVWIDKAKERVKR
jgi:hypothetical protein